MSHWSLREAKAFWLWSTLMLCGAAPIHSQDLDATEVHVTLDSALRIAEEAAGRAFPELSRFLLYSISPRVFKGDPSGLHWQVQWQERAFPHRRWLVVRVYMKDGHTRTERRDERQQPTSDSALLGRGAQAQVPALTFAGIGLSSDFQTVAARYPHSTPQAEYVALAPEDRHDHISAIGISGSGPARRVRIGFETRAASGRNEYPDCKTVEAKLIAQYGRHLFCGTRAPLGRSGPDHCPLTGLGA
jgi:hypothetical protein